MALISPPGGRRRPEAPHRLWVVSTWRGLLRVAAWPRKRGRARDGFMKSLQQRFAATVQSLKYQHAREVAPITDATAKHNAEVSGLKGTARLRVRDVQTKIAAGRMFAFQRPDGKIIWPLELAAAVSEALDWTYPQPGALLTVRGGVWVPTRGCTPGALFTAAPENIPTGCCADAAFDQEEKTMPANLSVAEKRVQDALNVLGQSEGDILYRDAELWKRLPIGTTGQVLTVDDNGLPSWQDLPPA